MESKRKQILRIHGTFAIVAGSFFAIASTVGMLYGIGPLGLLQESKLGHVGLMQAYMLFALIGAVLLMGSRQENVKKWNRVGAMAHVLILIVYVIHWNFFPTLENGEFMRMGGLVFHLTFLTLESWAGFFSK